MKHWTVVIKSQIPDVIILTTTNIEIQWLMINSLRCFKETLIEACIFFKLWYLWKHIDFNVDVGNSLRKILTFYLANARLSSWTGCQQHDPCSLGHHCPELKTQRNCTTIQGKLWWRLYKCRMCNVCLFCACVHAIVYAFVRACVPFLTLKTSSETNVQQIS